MKILKWMNNISCFDSYSSVYIETCINLCTDILAELKNEHDGFDV